MGRVALGAGGGCRHTKSGTKTQCRAQPGRCSEHLATCSCGPCRMRLHSSIPRLLKSFASQAGHFCDTERVVPEMRDCAPRQAEIAVDDVETEPGDQANGKEAVMDLVVHGETEPFRWCIDVTVRHPNSGRYRAVAAQRAGHAAMKAAREKRRRYPPAGGRAVTPMVWETWGRASQEVHEVVAEWAASACGRRRAGAAARLANRWLTSVDAAVHVWIADAIIAGAGGRAACAWHRQRSSFGEHGPATARVPGPAARPPLTVLQQLRIATNREAALERKAAKARRAVSAQVQVAPPGQRLGPDTGGGGERAEAVGAEAGGTRAGAPPP